MRVYLAEGLRREIRAGTEARQVIRVVAAEAEQVGRRRGGRVLLRGQAPRDPLGEVRIKDIAELAAIAGEVAVEPGVEILDGLAREAEQIALAIARRLERKEDRVHLDRLRPGGPARVRDGRPRGRVSIGVLGQGIEAPTLEAAILLWRPRQIRVPVLGDDGRLVAAAPIHPVDAAQ